jgi:hypothetical protein
MPEMWEITAQAPGLIKFIWGVAAGALIIAGVRAWIRR